jgi:hypothetical protein
MCQGSLMPRLLQDDPFGLYVALEAAQSLSGGETSKQDNHCIFRNLNNDLVEFSKWKIPRPSLGIKTNF